IDFFWEQKEYRRCLIKLVVIKFGSMEGIQMKRSFLVLSGILLSLLLGVIGINAQDRPINGGILNGKAVSLPKPEYPAEAKKDNAEGAIAVTVSIDEEGNVISAAAALSYQTAAQVGDDAAVA